jgi:hypothetical protein
MEGCRETQREYELLKRGLQTTQLAAKIRVSDDLHDALKNFEPQWRKSLSAWTLWSSQRGWKVLPYVFVGIALSLVLVIKKPWRPSGVKEFILAEHQRGDMDRADVGGEPSEPTPPANHPAVKSPTANPPDHAPATVPVVTGSPAPPPVSVPATDLPPIATTEAIENHKAQESHKAKEPVTPTKGFLMRGEIDVSDFDNTWPLIRDKIIALGGHAAGSVELGWLRKKDESYFHLTMPESNYNELELFLGTFGPVRFSKERHPRVMPSGQIRIILTVKDDGATNESPAETP